MSTSQTITVEITDRFNSTIDMSGQNNQKLVPIVRHLSNDFVPTFEEKFDIGEFMMIIFIIFVGGMILLNVVWICSSRRLLGWFPSQRGEDRSEQNYIDVNI